jgi:wyosine [tRNA(Phe)-imidazoG37] synthetase (radical SAM superfamily)
MGKRSEPIPGTFPSAEVVLQKLITKLNELNPKSQSALYTELDTITFAGNSEPSSHPEFVQIVETVMNLKAAHQMKAIINMLSNGSELHRPEIVQACNRLDETWVKLDCVDEDLFKRLNRPLSRIGSPQEHIHRITLLEKPKIQTLLWDCKDSRLSNNKEQNLEALLKAYLLIQAKEVHLYTVARKTPIEGLLPLSQVQLEAFASLCRKEGILVKTFASS